MPSGSALIAEVDAHAPDSGEIALWWLGQHGFIVKLGRTVLYVDAFVSDLPGRQVPPLLRPAQVTHADLVLGSHDHADHIDRAAWPGIAAASPQARFVVPELVRHRLSREAGIPLDRLAGLDDGRSLEIAGVRVTGIAAAHESLDRDAATGRYPYLGYVIEGNGATLYHAGDCCPYEGLSARLRRWPLDLALLPINGRDAARLSAGCIGNMTCQEAAELAGVLQPRCTIPTHYDMFATNAADPQLFVDYMRMRYPHLRVHVCAHGTRLVLSSGG